MAKLIEPSKFWNAYVSSLAFLFPGVLGLLIHFDSHLLRGTYDVNGPEYQLLDPFLLPISIASLVYTLFIIVTSLYLQSNYKRVVEFSKNDKWGVLSKCNWLYSLYGHCLHYYRGKLVWVGFEKFNGRFLVAVSLDEDDFRYVTRTLSIESMITAFRKSMKLLVFLGILIVIMAFFLIVNAIKEPLFFFLQMLILFVVLVLALVAVEFLSISKNIVLVNETRAESILQTKRLIGLLPDATIIGFVKAGSGLYVAIENKGKKKLILSTTKIE